MQPLKPRKQHLCQIVWHHDNDICPIHCPALIYFLVLASVISLYLFLKLPLNSTMQRPNRIKLPLFTSPPVISASTSMLLSCSGTTSHATLCRGGSWEIRLQAGLDSPLRAMRSEMMMCVSVSFSLPLTNNSMAAHGSPASSWQPSKQPSRQAVSHCFVMCFTLPALILAKVLTTPLLSKYAIFWLGTSTIE